MRKCADGSQKMSVAKQKSFLSLVAGNIDISIEGTHDTVRKFNVHYCQANPENWIMINVCYENWILL